LNLCLVLGTTKVVYATSLFTLAWTHSVEKTRWEEDWRVTPAGLRILEARIEGSGAGMEPPPDAVREGHYWRYHPKLPLQKEVVLARSGATGGDWQICFAGACRDVPETPDSGPAILRPCP
jgi:hypothetical protein